MISDNIYKYFSDFVFQRTGILYAEKDYYRLDSRINSLVAHFGCQSPDELFGLCIQNMTKDIESKIIDLCTNRFHFQEVIS